MEKSPANHFLILFRDSSCQFRGVYTMNPDSQELLRLTGVGPRTVSSSQVESMYKYSSDRKQFSSIPSKTIGMSVDAFTIPSHLWQGGGAAGGNRRASVTKKTAISKWRPDNAIIYKTKKKDKYYNYNVITAKTRQILKLALDVHTDYFSFPYLILKIQKHISVPLYAHENTSSTTFGI